METSETKHGSIHASVPAAMKEWVEERVTSGGFGSVSDYVRALIRSDQREQAREEVEARLLRALESPAEEMTPADWEEIRSEVAKRIEEKKRQSG